MCENYLPTKGAVEDVLMHELVHAYDNCRAELDTSDCVQVACAEVFFHASHHFILQSTKYFLLLILRFVRHH
jgi:hypothetical protein